MDYARVYREFISCRRQSADRLTGYSETHHILPRCMGGSDDPENLVRLTPEDHYFAHLLLAYAYGGKNWVAVHAMCHLSNDYLKARRSRLAARMNFGHVRRSLAAHYRDVLSGPNGKIADQRKFELRHLDGRSVLGNRFELSSATGVTRQQISAVLLGKKMSAHGWFSPLHNPDGLSRAEMISLKRRADTVFTLYHRGGEKWSGTKWEFRQRFGAALEFQHSQGGVQGWYRTEEQAREHGSLKRAALAAALAARGSIHGSANPNADVSVYRFRVVTTGEVIAATKTEIRERFGIRSASLCAIFSGRQAQTGGITLA